MVKQPYFMTNKAWYEYVDDVNSDVNTVLTEEGKKLPAVVDSYNDYLKEDGVNALNRVSPRNIKRM